MSGYTPKEDGYIEKRRKAYELLRELRESRTKGTLDDEELQSLNRTFLEGLSAGTPTVGTSSRKEDSLSSLAILGERAREAVMTMRNLYSRSCQELGYNHSEEELQSRLIEKINSLPAYPHTLNAERQRIAQEFLRRRGKGFLAWFRDEYLD